MAGPGAREAGARAGSICLGAWLVISLALSRAAASSLTRKVRLACPTRSHAAASRKLRAVA